MSNEQSAREFSLDIDRIAQVFGMKAEKAFRTIALNNYEEIIRRTPVGDPDYWKGHPKGNPSGNARPPKGYLGGTARNNWWFSINTPYPSPSGRSANKSQNNQAMNAATVGVMSAKLGDTLYFQNGVPYILKLENGTQSPRQAPYGMVAVTLANTELHFIKALLDAEAKGI